jgi:hypothetical protein
VDCDQNSVFFNFKEGKDPSYPNVFSRPLTLQEIDMKMVSSVSEASSGMISNFIFKSRCGSVQRMAWSFVTAA